MTGTHGIADGQRDVVLLGSTGSIGTQTVDVVTRAADRFRVTAVSAGGGNPRLLAEQAAQLGAEAVGVSRAQAADELREQLAAVWPGDRRQPKLYVGPEATEELAARPCDVVLNAVAGAQGLRATLAAVGAGRVVAADRSSPRVRHPVSSSRSTPSTPPLLSACAAAAGARCAGCSSPPAADPSAAAAGRTCTM